MGTWVVPKIITQPGSLNVLCERENWSFLFILFYLSNIERTVFLEERRVYEKFKGKWHTNFMIVYIALRKIANPLAVGFELLINHGELRLFAFFFYFINTIMDNHPMSTILCQGSTILQVKRTKTSYMKKVSLQYNLSNRIVYKCNTLPNFWRCSSTSWSA